MYKYEKRFYLKILMKNVSDLIHYRIHYRNLVCRSKFYVINPFKVTIFYLFTFELEFLSTWVASDLQILLIVLRVLLLMFFIIEKYFPISFTIVQISFKL